jgi:collagenase-like PrtC family protease
MSQHENIPSTETAPHSTTPLELLAPAGERSALEAALEAGADAVYFGLTSLNARRRAKNFRQEEFAPAVEAVHACGARAYLTLNIDLAQRELGQAARILELARQARVDAVLVRDPALLALKPLMPELEFHFSTQTCMTNSADVAAAGHLGAARVVLARELTLAEIKAASAVGGVQTEVFAQGALCFCVSGRCLLSSWAGGRSGNRGGCTSPCRVPWTIDGRSAGTPLSMRDLATVHRLDDLRKAGVAAVKIEGRLKTAAWVRSAVELYRRALTGQFNSQPLLAEAATLGAYTGRALTCGYLDGQRNDLTGVAARAPAEKPSTPAVEAEQPAATEEADDDELYFDLEINVTGKSIQCRCRCEDQSVEWSVPKTVVRRQHKAISVGQLLEHIEGQAIHGYQLGLGTTDDPDFLMVPRAANAYLDRISAIIRQAKKTPTEIVRVDLPEAVHAVLEPREPSPSNRRTLGQKPDRVRLDAKAVGSFLREVRPGGVIVEGMAVSQMEKVQAACEGIPLVVALPPVFFEDDVANVDRLVRQCVANKLPVEVNSWGGWWLARQAGAHMEGGPGLPVLNALAARVLADAGLTCVTLSPEADRRQLEELTAVCPAPCSMVVCGRPPLLISRAELSEDWLGRTFEDRRGVRLTPRRERNLWVFRPAERFELRGLTNKSIRVQHLVVDLVGAEDPLADWFDAPLPGAKLFRFNYDRTLA